MKISVRKNGEKKWREGTKKSRSEKASFGLGLKLDLLRERGRGDVLRIFKIWGIGMAWIMKMGLESFIMICCAQGIKKNNNNLLENLYL